MVIDVVIKILVKKGRKALPDRVVLTIYKGKPFLGHAGVDLH